MNRFLEAVRGSEKLRGFSRNVTFLGLGCWIKNYATEGLGDDLDEISLHCPNVVEIECLLVAVRLEYFRASFLLIYLGIASSQC
mgnify:CR=1 FL=1|jgi:hypothetical protein